MERTVDFAQLFIERVLPIAVLDCDASYLPIRDVRMKMQIYMRILTSAHVLANKHARAARANSTHTRARTAHTHSGTLDVRVASAMVECAHGRTSIAFCASFSAA